MSYKKKWWRPASIVVAACGLDIFWQFFDLVSLFSSAHFRYRLNELNMFPQLIYHKIMSNSPFSSIRIRKHAVRMGHNDRASSTGYDRAILTFYMCVIHGPPAECNTRLHSSLYYTHGLNNEHLYFLILFFNQVGPGSLSSWIIANNSNICLSNWTNFL